MDRIASRFITGIKFDTRELVEEIRKTIRAKYILFCEENGVENNINSYKKYRAVVRSIFGFDLIKNRPKKKVEPFETQPELF